MNDRADDPDGPAEPIEGLLEMSFGVLVMQVRELTAHVMALSGLLAQETRGSDFGPGELEAWYAQTRDDLFQLHSRISVLARQFGGPSQFPPPPGDE